VTSDETWPDGISFESPSKTGSKAVKDDPMPDGPTGKLPKGVEIENITGVFSSQTISKVGTGTTQRKTIQKAYWYAEEAEPDEENGIEPGQRVVMVQPLNNNNIPAGTKEAVPLEDFLKRFSPELEFYQEEVYPRMKELNTTLQRAESRRDQGALYSAQFEFENALNVDEQNVRANFGLGLTYMARGESEKAGDIFERVVKLDAAFAPEHKHLFNEFGINLRKSKLHDQAVDYYTRALQITTNDENLYYNIARAYFERGDLAECRENLDKALQINPTFEAARQFMDFLKKKEG